MQSRSSSEHPCPPTRAKRIFAHASSFATVRTQSDRLRLLGAGVRGAHVSLRVECRRRCGRPRGSSPLGVYVGYQSPGGVSSFGRAVGQQPTFAMDFLDGDSWSALVNTAPAYMSAWKGSGYTMIWGLPMLPNSGSTLAQGASGAYNSYFLQLAQEMVAGGQGSSIVRPGWEFNGGWFSWAANGQASAFVTFWQQIVNTMRSVPGQNFTFEWNPTAGDTGVGNLAQYYPGNAYVDQIGLDLYDQQWGTYPGIAAQWNTDLTEPYGLNWLASFAASQGKQITLPEWGLDPDPSSNNGGVLSGNGEVGGGDDPTFINDVAQWITQNQVYEATYWQYNSSLLSSRSNPNSFAAFVQDFGSGSGTSSGQGGTSTTSPARRRPPLRRDPPRDRVRAVPVPRWDRPSPAAVRTRLERHHSRAPPGRSPPGGGPTSRRSSVRAAPGSARSNGVGLLGDQEPLRSSRSRAAPGAASSVAPTGRVTAMSGRVCSRPATVPTRCR